MLSAAVTLKMHVSAALFVAADCLAFEANPASPSDVHIQVILYVLHPQQLGKTFVPPTGLSLQ